MNAIYQDFFSAFELSNAPLGVVYLPEHDPEMLIGTPDTNGYIMWKFLDCEQPMVEVFSQYEKTAGRQLPESFKNWYAFKYSLDLDASVVSLPVNPKHSPGKGLLKKVMPGNDFWERPLALGLLPFGEENFMNAGPVCFDTRIGGDPNNWLIRYWNHEWIDHPNEIGPVMFSSFDRLILAVTEFLKHAYGEGIAQNQAIDAMMAADPEGAGGSGRKYWELFYYENS